MKPKPKFHWKDRPRGKNDALFYKLRSMPPVSHWPNRAIPYSPEKSECVQYILALIQPEPIQRAESLFHMASKKGVILFDKGTKLWKGNELWQSEFTEPPEIGNFASEVL